MLTRTLTIYKKTRERGLSWLYQRLILELRIPETALGKKIYPTSRAVYQIYTTLASPFKLLRKRKPLLADTLYLFYDLEILPITFNISETLSMADLHRKKLGLKHLHVVFVPGPEGGLRKEMVDYERFIDKDARQWRKFNLLFPITHLIPSCVGFSNCSSRQEAELIRRNTLPNVYPPRYSTVFPTLVSFYEGARTRTADMMALQATPKALQYIDQWLKARITHQKLIIITLRQYSYMPKRNSNIVAWANFAKSLDPEKYFVVIVPDTEVTMQKPNPELAEFEHFMEACWNIELRAALYEKAYLNLGINNGPLSLCWLNRRCRYIMFKILTEDVPQTTIAAQERHGFIQDKPPAFALEHQKWVWESDNEEVIQREFANMCRILN